MSCRGQDTLSTLASLSKINKRIKCLISSTRSLFKKIEISHKPSLSSIDTKIQNLASLQVIQHSFVNIHITLKAANDPRILVKILETFRSIKFLKFPINLTISNLLFIEARSPNALNLLKLDLRCGESNFTIKVVLQTQQLFYSLRSKSLAEFKMSPQACECMLDFIYEIKTCWPNDPIYSCFICKCKIIAKCLMCSSVETAVCTCLNADCELIVCIECELKWNCDICLNWKSDKCSMLFECQDDNCDKRECKDCANSWGICFDCGDYYCSGCLEFHSRFQLEI